MRSSLWIAASAAALFCFGQTAGAQNAKQDGGGSSGATQRGESGGGAGGGKQDGGASGERKSSDSKSRDSRSSGSDGAGEGSQGSGRATSRSDDDGSARKSDDGSARKSNAGEKSKSGRQGADEGQAAGTSGRDQGKGAESGKDADRSKGAEKSDRKDDAKRGGKAAADDSKAAEPKSKAADRTKDDTKSKSDRGEKSKSADSDKDRAKSATKDANDRDKNERGGGAATGAATGTGGTERDQKGSAAQDRRGESRVRISAQQRTTVHERVLKSTNVNRVDQVNISINIGTRVPRSVRLAKLPADVVEIVPQYRSYEYFVSGDRICIVEPSTYEIVEVIDTSGGPRSAATVQSGGLRLTAEEREIVLRTVDVRDGPRGLPIPREGAEIPDRVEVRTFPRATLREVPKLERYRYFAAEASIVIVDPRDERVELVVGDK